MTSLPRYVKAKTTKGHDYWYWSPPAAGVAAGFKPTALGKDREAAIAQAIALNARLDAARQQAGAWQPPAPDATPPVRVAPGSVNAVWNDYLTSRFWAARTKSTQAGYRSCANRILRLCGDLHIGAITPKHVQDYYKKLTNNFTQHFTTANYTIRVLQVLLKHGSFMGLCTGTAANEARLEDHSEPGTPWSHEAVEAIDAAARAAGWHVMATAVRLNEWIGQRAGDVLAIVSADIGRDGKLRITQGKTGVTVVLPVADVPALAAHLADWQAHRQAIVARLRKKQLPFLGRALLIRDTDGRDWTRNHFSHEFRQVADAARDAARKGGDAALAAELDGIQFQWLRHTAVTRMADAGCSIEEIRAITGHTLKSANSILERYMARTGNQAAAAFARRLAHEQSRRAHAAA